MLKIIEPPDIEEYNNFITKNSLPSSFQQSWQWGEFQEQLGNRVTRFTLDDDKQIYASGQVVTKKLSLGYNYLDLSRGPIINSNLEISVQNMTIKKIIDQIRELSSDKTVFIRLDPPYADLPNSIHELDIKIPKILTKQIEPSDTVLVDLTKSETELFSNAHKKTRYNIRQSVKKSVKINDASGDSGALDKFLDLIHETSQRDRINFWPDSRYKLFADRFIRRKLSNMSSNQPTARLFLAEKDGLGALAGAIIMLFGNCATYLYAASSSSNRDLQAPNLLLWELIKFAKKDGRQWFDMWGIKPTNAGDEHPWTGITRFKSRFISPGITGQIVHFNGAVDYLKKPWLYQFFSTSRLLSSAFKKLSQS